MNPWSIPKITQDNILGILSEDINKKNYYNKIVFCDKDLNRYLPNSVLEYNAERDRYYVKGVFKWWKEGRDRDKELINNHVIKNQEDYFILGMNRRYPGLKIVHQPIFTFEDTQEEREEKYCQKYRELNTIPSQKNDKKFITRGYIKKDILLASYGVNLELDDTSHKGREGKDKYDEDFLHTKFRIKTIRFDYCPYNNRDYDEDGYWEMVDQKLKPILASPSKKTPISYQNSAVSILQCTPLYSAIEQELSPEQFMALFNNQYRTCYSREEANSFIEIYMRIYPLLFG